MMDLQTKSSPRKIVESGKRVVMEGWNYCNGERPRERQIVKCKTPLQPWPDM